MKTSMNNSLKSSLIAFSFHTQLTSTTADKMTLDDVLKFCTNNGFDAIDPTAYYFPNYPDVPLDDVLFEFKRKAHNLGLGISGTGVKTDFTNPDATARNKDIFTTKLWIEAAAKLGAPVIRVMAGPERTGESDIILHNRVVKCLKECISYGKEHGVIVGIKNNGDYLKSADRCIKLMKDLDKRWSGIIVDTSNFLTPNPYDDIARVAPFAVNWQIKRSLTAGGVTQTLNFRKLIDIIINSGYRGYLPVEAIEPENPTGYDPQTEAVQLLAKLQHAL